VNYFNNQKFSINFYEYQLKLKSKNIRNSIIFILKIYRITDIKKSIST